MPWRSLNSPVARACLVTRAKKNFRAQRVCSSPTERALDLIADQTVPPDGVRSKHHYREHLRRIRNKDPASDNTLVFLANRANLPALTVCDPYRSRWQVELFFEFVKGNLRIHRFLGTSEYAVKSQLWIAVSVFVLAAILRKRLVIDTPLHAMLQILRVVPFEQVKLYEALTTQEAETAPPANAAQLPLFAT